MESGIKYWFSFLKNKWPRHKNERRLVFNFLKDFELLKKESNLDKRKKIIDQFYRFMDQVEDLKLRGQL